MSLSWYSVVTIFRLSHYDLDIYFLFLSNSDFSNPQVLTSISEPNQFDYVPLGLQEWTKNPCTYRSVPAQLGPHFATKCPRQSLMFIFIQQRKRNSQHAQSTTGVVVVRTIFSTLY